MMYLSRRLYPRSWLHHSAVGQISIIGMQSVQQCVSENGYSHLIMIHAWNWRFRLNAGQPTIILSSVLHNRVSNSTLFHAFSCEEVHCLVKFPILNMIVLIHAMNVR